MTMNKKGLVMAHLQKYYSTKYIWANTCYVLAPYLGKQCTTCQPMLLGCKYQSMRQMLANTGCSYLLLECQNQPNEIAPLIALITLQVHLYKIPCYLFQSLTFKFITLANVYFLCFEIITIPITVKLIRVELNGGT